MKRVLTAAVAAPLALLAVFRLPTPWFLLLVAVLVEIGVFEYVRLARRIAPGARTGLLLVAVPAAALALGPAVPGWPQAALEWDVVIGLAALVPLIFGGAAVVSGGAPPAAAVAGIGLASFGLLYLAVPLVSLAHLQDRDRWLLLLLLLVVWIGDSAAYYVGSRWGRRKLAPVVSPNKTWEGSVAGLIASLAAAAGWVLLRPEPRAVQLLVLAVLTALAAQIGDLVESLIKRSAGVKDSGGLMPGHGGVLDRIDALLFAAPVWFLGLRLLGLLEARP